MPMLRQHSNGSPNLKSNSAQWRGSFGPILSERAARATAAAWFRSPTCSTKTAPRLPTTSPKFARSVAPSEVGFDRQRLSGPLVTAKVAMALRLLVLVGPDLT